jgi:hypothetical protein
MEEITIPCPTDGCEGSVTVTAEPVMNGTQWKVQHIGDTPAVTCSNSCKSPAELEQPVAAVLQAG